MTDTQGINLETGEVRQSGVEVINKCCCCQCCKCCKPCVDWYASKPCWVKFLLWLAIVIVIIVIIVVAAYAGVAYWTQPDFPAIQYGTDAKQVLDIYLPSSDNASAIFPAVFYLHGRASNPVSQLLFSYGDKSLYAYEAPLKLKSNGIALVSVEWRTPDKAKWPSQVNDIKAAIRFVRANAAKYKIDPARFAIWGVDVGAMFGNLAAVAAKTGDLDDCNIVACTTSAEVLATVSWAAMTDVSTIDADLSGVSGCTALNYNTTGYFMEMFGSNIPLADPAIVAKSSVANYITPANVASMPTFFMQHGDKDCVVPLAQSDKLIKAIYAAESKTSVTSAHQLEILAGVGKFEATPFSTYELGSNFDKVLPKFKAAFGMA